MSARKGTARKSEVYIPPRRRQTFWEWATEPRMSWVDFVWVSFLGAIVKYVLDLL